MRPRWKDFVENFITALIGIAMLGVILLGLTPGVLLLMHDWYICGGIYSLLWLSATLGFLDSL